MLIILYKKQTYKFVNKKLKNDFMKLNKYKNNALTKFVCTYLILIYI